MSIVNWKQEVKISGNTERDQELLLATLRTNIKPNNKWQGTVVKRKDEKVRFVELRKINGGTNIVLTIANKGWQYHRKRENFTDTAHLNIRMSMNGTAMMTLEDMNEMNLAILEAQGVLENENQF